MSNDKRFMLVDGAKNAAIYDLESGKVYAVNASGKQILHRLLEGDELVREDELAYLRELDSLGISASTLGDDSRHGPYELEGEDGLDYVWLELTEKCNCNCVHCYGQWGDALKNSHVGLDRDWWLKILDEVYRRGGRAVQLIGGEPLLHPDFASILRHAHQLGMERIDVFTNATLVDEAAAELLRENGANVRVSLYGHCAEIHEKVTQRTGSFSKTERGLKLLKQVGVPVKTAVIVMDLNEEHISEIQRYIEDLGLEFDGYDTIRQAVGGDQISHCVSSPEVLSVRYQTKPSFETSQESFCRNHRINSCWYRKLAFAANGDVYPCIFARDFRIGNILEESFDEVFAKAKIPWTTTIDTVEGCGECEFRYACSDCRPLAKSLTGKPDGKYPRCTYSPAEGIWKKLENVTVELKKP